MEPHFYFRRSRSGNEFAVSTSSGQRGFDGSIYCKLTLGEVALTPFSTGINGFYQDWVGRLMLRPPAASLKLAEELKRYQDVLAFAHQELQRAEVVITRPILLEEIRYIHSLAGKRYVPRDRRSASDFGGAVISVSKVYAEFMKVKETLIEDDHRKRSPEQIAQATFDSYPRRWALVQGYLSAIKKGQIEITRVDYPLVTNMKEWLCHQETPSGAPYKLSSLNRAIGFLKNLMSYAMSKGYVTANPIIDFPCRGGGSYNPRPLTEAHMITLENFPLSPTLRHLCDSWIVAAELCLHYSDFKQLPTMEIIVTGGNGKPIKRFIRHDRQKQSGSELWQTVDITPRAERIIAKWGISGLYYRSSAYYSKQLKKIARLVDLRDRKGDLIELQFGQGRDTGLTGRAVAGAPLMTLAAFGGWRKAAHAASYIDGALEMADNFARRDDPPTE